MSQKTHVIHGRDHRPVGWNGPSDPGGADPLTWWSQGRRDMAAWNDLVTSHGPRFWWYFQDSFADNQVTDLTGHSHPLTLSSISGPTQSTVAHMFADQTYSMKTLATDTNYATASVGSPWGNGLASWSCEVWFRPSSLTRGQLIGNQASSAGSTYWGFGLNASNLLAVKRYGSALTTPVTPTVDAWQQFVIVANGSTVTVYYNGSPVGSITDVAGTSGDLQVNREYVSGATYASLAGYYGAIVGYDSALTAEQVFELYQAGLASGNPAETDPPSGIGAGEITPTMIAPGADGTWLHTTGGAVVWQPIALADLPAGVELTAHKDAASGYAGLTSGTKLSSTVLPFTGTPDGSKFLRDDLSWQTAGGGGGGFPSGDPPPASPDSANAEFDSTTLPSGYSILVSTGTLTNAALGQWLDTNPSNPTWNAHTDIKGSLVMQPTAGATMKLVKNFAPGNTRWAIITKVRIANLRSTDDRINLGVETTSSPTSASDEPSSGFWVQFRVEAGSSTTVFRTEIRSYWKQGGTPSSQTYVENWYNTHAYLALLGDTATSGTVGAYVSSDGIGWVFIRSANAGTISAAGAGIASMFVSIQDNSSGTPTVAVIDFVRFLTGENRPWLAFGYT